jgi:hypothetical protein
MALQSLYERESGGGQQVQKPQYLKKNPGLVGSEPRLKDQQQNSYLPKMSSNIMLTNQNNQEMMLDAHSISYGS